MDTVLYLIALVVIVAMMVIAMRYTLKHFGGTFSAWGAKHYAERSGTDDDRRHD